MTTPALCVPDDDRRQRYFLWLIDRYGGALDFGAFRCRDEAIVVARRFAVIGQRALPASLDDRPSESSQ